VGAVASADQFEVDLDTQTVKIYEGDKELPSFDLVTEKIGKTGKTVSLHPSLPI
jgi:hypothetical protein